MNENYRISTHCIIQDNQITRDGEVVYVDKGLSFGDFTKSAYKNLQIDYPKFYKMDNLSKLGFIAAEIVLNGVEDKENIALILANRSGSLDTDVRHQESIQQEDGYFPSPAVFVYTLANICAGEINIRHNMRSENVFFVSEVLDYETLVTYATYLLESNKAEKVLCGWIELFSDKYKAVLYLVEQIGALPHNEEQIKQLFLK